MLLSRNMSLPVTQAVLNARALLVRDRLFSSALPKFVENRTAKFTASKGRVTRFVKRHALRSVAHYGEAASTSVVDAAQEMSKFCAKLKDNDPEWIFDVNKTSIFFRVSLRRTYLYHAEDIKYVCGTKGMQAKDCLTAYVSTIVVGNKVSMSIIGNSKNPRCSWIAKPPVVYFTQHNA